VTAERLLIVCLGGAIGTGLRFVTAVAAARWLGAEFPWGTLIVNLVGSFAIGLVQHVAFSTLLVPEPLRLFLTAGVMGGLTTYSAFSYETIRLLELGAWRAASAYVAGTTTLCLLLCFLGVAAGQVLTGRG
jgi:CrcB protein